MALPKTQRIVLLAATVAMFAIATATRRYSIVPILIAVLCLLWLATFLSHAGRLSESLRPFQNRALEIRVWGQLLLSTGNSACQIESIRAFGAGLHLFVRCEEGSPVDLKIAQPRRAVITEQAVEIREAAYVQWAGKKLPRVAESPAITLTLITTLDGEPKRHEVAYFHRPPKPRS